MTSRFSSLLLISISTYVHNPLWFTPFRGSNNCITSPPERAIISNETIRYENSKYNLHNKSSYTWNKFQFRFFILREAIHVSGWKNRIFFNKFILHIQKCVYGVLGQYSENWQRYGYVYRKRRVASTRRAQRQMKQKRPERSREWKQLNKTKCMKRQREYCTKLAWLFSSKGPSIYYVDRWGGGGGIVNVVYGWPLTICKLLKTLLFLYFSVYKNFKRVFLKSSFSKLCDGLHKNDFTDFDEILMTSRKHNLAGIESTRLAKKKIFFI